MLIVKASDWRHQTEKAIANDVYDKFVRNMEPAATTIDGSCTYASREDRQCAVGCQWPLELAQKVQQGDGRGIGFLVHSEIVELPDGVDATFLTDIQRWHDGTVANSMNQAWRHKHFPHLDLIDEPLVFESTT